MNDLVFVSKSFDQNKTKEYCLSIQLGLDGFSFSVLDGKNNCIALKRLKSFKQNSEPENISSCKELFRNDSLLNHPFKKVAVLWISNQSLVIPADFFSKEFAIESFRLSYSLTKKECLVWNKIDELNAWNVFSMPELFKKLIESQFPAARLLHHTYPFYRKALQSTPFESHPKVFMHVQKDFFHIIIPDQNQKHYINTFSYREDTDLAYYILTIYKQQNLNNERSPLIVDGWIENDGKLVKLLRKYLKQVKVQQLSSELMPNQNLSEIEYNPFFNLLNLSRCEL